MTPISDAGYWDAARNHQLWIRQCPRCAASLHPRRTLCPACGCEELLWRAASGRATVYSVSTLYRAPTPELAPALPYHLGIVELDEGVYLFTRFETVLGGAAPGISDPVEVAFAESEEGRVLPVFRPSPR